MKVPSYISEGTLSESKIQTPQVADPIDLSNLIRGVERQADFYMEKQAQEWKAYAVAETQTAQLDIDVKYNEIMERVKNGGSYGSAEEEFKKFYDKRTAQTLQNLSQDERLAALSRLDFEKQGVEYGLRLKNAVSTRRKSDAIQAVNSRVDLLKREYIDSVTPEAKMNVIQKLNSAISGLENSGAIQRGSGQEKVKAFVSDVKGMELSLIEASKGWEAASAFLESNKNDFSIDSYVRKKVDYEKMSQAAAVEKIVTEDFDVDISQTKMDNYEESLSNNVTNGVMDEQTAEDALIYSIARSGKVPKNTKRLIDGILSVSPDTLTPQIATRIANAARLVSNSVSLNPALANGTVEGFGEQERITASMINKRIENGEDAFSAVKSVMTKRNDPNFSEIYKDARNNFLKSKNYPKYIEKVKDKLDLDDASMFYVLPDIIDSFTESKILGASDKDALEEAMNKSKGKVGKFNGVNVMYPPHKVTSYRSEDIWIDAAKNALKQIMPEIDGAEPVLFGDAKTISALKNGVPSKEVPFLLQVKTKDGGVYPVTNPKTGNLVYIKANPRETSKVEFISKKLEGSTIDYNTFMQFIADRGYTEEYVRNKFNLVRIKFVNSEYLEKSSQAKKKKRDSVE